MTALASLITLSPSRRAESLRAQSLRDTSRGVPFGARKIFARE